MDLVPRARRAGGGREEGTEDGRRRTGSPAAEPGLMAGEKRDTGGTGEGRQDEIESQLRGPFGWR